MTLQTLTIALPSAAVGTLVTLVVIYRVTGQPPDPAFSIAIPTLATLTATAAAIPPALVAAYRDPVRILRIP